MYLSQSFKIDQSHNSGILIKDMSVFRVVRGRCIVPDQQPMRGEAAVSLGLQVQPGEPEDVLPARACRMNVNITYTH